MFSGDLAVEECSEPVLNIRFSDGTSANYPVPTGALACLGHSASLEDIGRLYPAIPYEPFFSGWARAVRRQARLRNRSCVPVTVEPVEAALVFAIPSERCDAFLLFEELTRQLGTKVAPPGLVFIANRNSNRADIVAFSVPWLGMPIGRAVCS